MDFIVKNLNENEEYIFRVMAVNLSGRSAPRESKPITVKESTMLPEFDLRAVCQKTVIAKAGDDIKVEIPVIGRPRPTVSWQKDGTALKLTQRTNAEMTGATVVLSIGECNRSDSGVYTMTGKNIAGTVSENLIVRVHDVPGPPKGPVKIVEISRTYCVFSWEPPENDGGVPINNYVVEIRDTTSQTWTELSATVIRTVFKAAAVPENPKAEDRLLPPEMDVDAELRKVVSLRACCSLRLFVPIRGRPTPTAKWTKEDGETVERATIDTTTSYTSLVIENVNRFDSGKYNLTVENSSGSKTVTVQVRVLDTPSAPQNLKITAVTYESVTLTWDPPANDGGVKIKNYIVEKRESTRKAYATDVTKSSVTLTWEKPAHDGGSRVGCYVVEVQPKGVEKWTQALIVKETEATISNLNAGEEYMFRVAARNEKGTSDPRQIGVPVIVKDLVIAPDVKMLFNTFSVLAGEDLTIDIPFVARPKAAVSWVKDGVPLKRTTRVNFSATETMLNLNIKEATREDVGQYLITLTNTAGETKAEVGVVVLDKPGQPMGPVKVEEVTSDSISISWSPPEYQGGCTELPEGRWLKANFTNVIETEYVATGLVPDNQYEFRVIARNAAGVFSLPSYSTGPITAKDEIEPPRLSIDPEYTQTLVVNAGDNFKIDADVHGKPLPSIHWMMGEQELGNTIHREIKNLPTKAFISVKEAKLSDGGEYTLLLRNPGGEKSVKVNVMVLDKPGEPQGPVNVTGIMKDRCCISWKAPLQDGGSKISHYIVERRETSRLVWTVIDPKVESTCLKVTKLLEGDEYIFRIRAVNQFGVGAPLESAPVLIKDPYLPPERRETSRLAWTVVCSSCTAPCYKVTKLLEGNEYTFRVMAVNKYGTSEPLESGNVVMRTPFVAPGPPHIEDVSHIARDGMTLTWTAPESDGGSE
uniref:Titin n=1 Tax=Periophthalmus magnuspinnatus TaxID=409849 RepID=A0A3B4AC56_9GOBI